MRVPGYPSNREADKGQRPLPQGGKAPRGWSQAGRPVCAPGGLRGLWPACLLAPGVGTGWYHIGLL